MPWNAIGHTCHMQYFVCLHSFRLRVLCVIVVVDCIWLSSQICWHKKETRNVWCRLSYLGIISLHDKNRTHLNHLSSFSNNRMSTSAVSSRCQGCASSSLRAKTRYKNVFVFSSGWLTSPSPTRSHLALLPAFIRERVTFIACKFT